MRTCTLGPEFRWLMLILTAQVGSAHVAMAQAGVPPDSAEITSSQRSRSHDDSLAYRYAPELRFAPQERYFPILPFFKAFLRGVERSAYLTPALVGQPIEMGNGRDTLAQWNPLTEAEAVKSNRDTLILWNALLRDYETLQVRDRDERLKLAEARPAPDQGRDTSSGRRPYAQDSIPQQRRNADQASEEEWAPSVAALFYRVYHLTQHESEEVWDRLQSDFQLWARLDIPDSLRAHATANRDLPRFISLEYYAYYIRDLGLTGHAQDLEKFFVFIPEDATPVQIMVGAAHSVVTPNNVVILARKQGRSTFLYTPHAFVEYGGHSFSPDVPPLGSFTPGWDINWRASERSWGVRDMQAVLGTGFSGDYRSQYTLPRTDSVGVTLKPLAPGNTLSASRRRSSGDERSYALIPIEPYRRFFEALDSTEGRLPERIQRVRQAWDSVLGPVLSRTMDSVRMFPSDSAGGRDVYERLRLWLKQDLAQEEEDSVPGRARKLSKLKGSGNKMRPWLADEYVQPPQHIMKAWLYRPQDPNRKCRLLSTSYFPAHIADLKNLEAGVRYGIGKKWAHTGLTLEATDAYHCIERGSKLNVPGTLGLGIAISPFDLNQGPQEVYLRYQHRYFSPQTVTWSLGLSLVVRYDSTESQEVLRDASRERSRFRLRPAITIMPIGLIAGATMEPKRKNLFWSSLAVRVGPQIDLFHPSRSMAWQIEIAVRPNSKYAPGGKREEDRPIQSAIP